MNSSVTFETTFSEIILNLIVIGEMRYTNKKRPLGSDKFMKLSICIPTYNQGAVIGEALHSIIPQLNDQVEIVILDGASTDNTEKIVQSYQERCSKIRYFKRAERGGVDKDIDLCVEKALGEYCWLFGSDDVMKKGAIEQILREIELGVDVYLCGFTFFSRIIDEVRDDYKLSTITESMIFDFSDIESRRRYFAAAYSLRFLFSSLSLLIIKRGRWLQTQIDSSIYGTGIAHASRVLRMIPMGLKLKYIPTSLFLKRTSPFHQDSIQQISRKLDGYFILGQMRLGSDRFEEFYIRKVLQKEFFIHAFLDLRKQIKNIKDAQRIFSLICKIYRNRQFAKLTLLVITFAFPDFFVRVLKRLRRIQKTIFLNIFTREDARLAS